MTGLEPSNFNFIDRLRNELTLQNILEFSLQNFETLSPKKNLL